MPDFQNILHYNIARNVMEIFKVHCNEKHLILPKFTFTLIIQKLSLIRIPQVKV